MFAFGPQQNHPHVGIVSQPRKLLGHLVGQGPHKALRAAAGR